MARPRVRILRQCHRWDPHFPLARPELEAMMDRILDILGLHDATLSLKLVDDVAIAKLNRKFMGCEGPTNVLSFPAEEEETPDSTGEQELGEIALSVETLARETFLYGQAPVEHLARLLAHAILHLAGFDHGIEMEALTEAAVEGFRDDYPACG